jgi:hypothetical protein
MSIGEQHIFDWLDRVRQRPGMWVGSLRDLEMLVWGYYAALAVHHVDEGVPSMSRHFSSWLMLKKRRWSLCLGWADAIEKHIRKGTDPLDVFFRLTDEYRKLRPVVRCYAVLGPAHLPTGKRCEVGDGCSVSPPNKIEVIQYQPEPLHFLRVHYTHGLKNEDVLYTGVGGSATTLAFAKQCAEAEFQVRPAEWVDVP